MSARDTVRRNRRLAGIQAQIALGFVFPLAALAQAPTSVQSSPQSSMDWRHVGNANIELGLAGLASGPVQRVWYSADGSKLSLRTAAGATFETADFETWVPGAGSPPETPPSITARRSPEPSVTIRKSGQSGRLYAFARFVYRSDDDGRVWENLTGFHSKSIIGAGLRDLAVSPTNPDDVTVAGASGVFRSVDGGQSWSGLNQGLPNLPAARIRSLPSGGVGARLELTDASIVEWRPGERTAWRPSDSSEALTELRLRQALSLERRAEVTAVAIRGGYVYTGMADGSIQVSADSGRTWLNYATQGGVRQPSPVTGFWIDQQDPRVALAVLGAHPVTSDVIVPSHVVRTLNGGAFWDNITANLPDVSVNGVAADRASGAIYIATRQGVFMTRTDLGALAPASAWTSLSGLPAGPAADVKLDGGGNQLWVALDGLGTFVSLAPHRLTDPRVVSAADFVARAVAPGSLVSVAGAKVETALAGTLNVPVLAASDTESQLQVPFEARGQTLSLAINGANGRRVLDPLPLGTAAPAIFVNRDGAPLLLDAESGVILDAMHPAHSGTRVQILATGLGQVTPDWPTGAAVPELMTNPPRVMAPVKAWLDRSPVEVTRSVLAPGYVGFYLIEVEIPKIVNFGPAELYVEADGTASNAVRLYIEP